ncbi:efflux RND transporter periplasmic adaptor subunit [candidate division KSB1 bacterium]|nr:efflux RND transporter periplasmic adaptor subunit [candidate division KSB1 bacterium]
MKKAIKINFIYFPFVFLFFGLLVNCSSDSEESRSNRENQLIPAVEAIQAQYGVLPLTERLTGVVRAENQIAIYPELSAPITAVYVQNGDVVKAGQILVTLRDNEFQERLRQAQANYQIAVAQVKQAEAQLKKIKAELTRMQTLADQALASPAQLEAAQAEATSAEADLELAKARVEQAQATTSERKETLAQTVIRAPVSGTVGSRNAEMGMMVDGNSRLFTLGQLDNVRIEVVLTDRMLNYIEPGQRAEIFSENLAFGVTSAPLRRISPFLHPVTHSTEAEIDIANPEERLKSGMFVTVDIHYGESEQATLVPQSALYENPNTGETGVYVSQDTLGHEVASLTAQNTDESIALTPPISFRFVPVEIIARGRMQAGVRGVESGDWVITLGQNLFGGEPGKARVRPVEWGWVEELQNLQRQDLMQEVMREQQAALEDTVLN